MSSTQIKLVFENSSDRQVHVEIYLYYLYPCFQNQPVNLKWNVVAKKNLGYARLNNRLLKCINVKVKSTDCIIQYRLNVFNLQNISTNVTKPEITIENIKFYNFFFQTVPYKIAYYVYLNKTCSIKYLFLISRNQQLFKKNFKLQFSLLSLSLWPVGIWFFNCFIDLMFLLIYSAF